MASMSLLSNRVNLRAAKFCRPFLYRHVSLFSSKRGISAKASENPKAAALIIGNEVLNGSIEDKNLPFLGKFLYARGVDLIRAEFVPDDIEEISSTLLSLKEKVGEKGFVFTSGGIGPTHDDMTYESIAKAFGTTCELHEGTVERMTKHYESQGKEVTQARLRMALLPKGCDVLYTPGLWVPLAVIEETYILPGIPRLFSSMIKGQSDRFKGTANFTLTVFCDKGEGEIADMLRTIDSKYSSVDIGSYPKTTSEQPYSTKLVLVARDQTDVLHVQQEIMDTIPGCWKAQEDG